MDPTDTKEVNSIMNDDELVNNNQQSHANANNAPTTCVASAADTADQAEINHSLSDHTTTAEPIIIETEICGVNMMSSNVTAEPPDAKIAAGKITIESITHQTSSAGTSGSKTSSAAATVTTAPAAAPAPASATSNATATTAAASPIAPALSYTGSIICRICHNTDRIDRLISPCLCKGSLGYVHRQCLEYWLSRSGIMHCELCMFQYKTQSTLRYNCCQSARIWFRHPNHRGLLQSDLMVCSLLTIVTFGLVSMSLVGLQYFMLQGNRMGFPRLWTQGSLATFLLIIVAAYCVNVFLIARAQFCPWYRWWRSVRVVEVVLPNNRISNSNEHQLHDIILARPESPRSTSV